MHADRPSFTASLVAAIRALYTELPPPYRIAPDPFAVRLLPGWLGVPARVAGVLPTAAPALHSLGRVVAFGLVEHVALRTRAIDDALREALSHTKSSSGGPRPTQLVILGAGLDSRALRLEEVAEVTTFEVDHPNTHHYKKARLANVLSTHKAVIQVPINFETEHLVDVLRAAGFDAASPTFWIWEGVTVYLTPVALQSTIKALGELSAPGSRLAVTYSRPSGHRSPVVERLFTTVGRLVGEPVPGMIATSALLSLFESVGFSLISDESVADWAPRYWPPSLGAGGPLGALSRVANGQEWERLLIVEKGASSASRTSSTVG